MRIIATTIVLLLLGTTVSAAGNFEQAYKNAKTSSQKIRVLFAELKSKDIEIANLKEQLAQRVTTKEQELLDKILVLNASNEDKDKEIQRLLQEKEKVPDTVRCNKDYWGIDRKDILRNASAEMILSYNAAQARECLAGKR